MNCANKLFPLLLFLLLAISSLIIVESTFAQSIHKPSVPEFSLKLVDFSYDTRAIELTIKNQPFVSYNDNGQIISLHYNVHFKLHDSDSWTAMYYCGDIFPTHSSSDYTKLDYPLPLISSSGSSYYLLRENGGNYNIMSQISFNEQIDFRVQAMEGYLMPSSFTGQTSDWNVQTITISGVSTSPNPTSTPTAPEFSWFVILPLFVIVLSVAFVLRVKLRKRK